MAEIVKLPRTGPGRQALKEALFILRNVGPSPEGYEIDGLDWDKVAEYSAEMASVKEARK